MLIKTIEMETADDKLFSKSAPLLAAAAECAYYTVKCSSLNAEEMRRENGLEILFQVRIKEPFFKSGAFLRFSMKIHVFLIMHIFVALPLPGFRALRLCFESLLC